MKLYPVLLGCALAFLAGCSSTGASGPAAALTSSGTSTQNANASGATPAAPNHRDTVVVARAQSMWKAPLPAERTEFARALAAHLQVPESRVQATLDQAQYNSQVARLMTPPVRRAGAPIVRNWPGYRARFVEPIRIREGLNFWRRNQAILERAERQYGVPASVIVAIIGVETVYGRNTGSFPVLDALYTLAFSYPSDAPRDRSPYFREELGEYLAMTLRNGVDPRSITGSYAGAIGIPQFMPGSIRRYAIGATHRDAPDLINSEADAIMSVANYLAAHGWRPGHPVFAPVSFTQEPKALANGGLEPTLAWQDLAAAGARVDSVAAAGLISEGGNKTHAWMRGPLGVIDLPRGRSGPVEYRVGTPNFFAITHYNRSYFYASAVADLAQRLEQDVTR